MSCTNYKIIEMMNNNIGAVAANAYMPLGSVTRRISTSTGSGVPFETTSSNTDTIQITQKGYYKVYYNCTLTIAAAGAVGIALVVNGTPVYSVSETGAIGTVNLTLVKEVRVFANCASCATNCPLNIQFQLTGSDITAGTAVAIIDSCVNG